MRGWELLGAHADAGARAGLERFVSELLRWNKAIRLVGPKDAEGIRLQVVDALLPFFEEAPAFPLLDIGSGAGFPALPLALLHPGERVVCLEPLAKRVSFLRHAARHLGLDAVEVVEGRAERAHLEAPALAGAFACVTARAVADVATLLAWAEPYLAPGGRVLLGRGAEEAVEAGGWRLLRHERYPAPPGVGLRAVAVYEKKS